MLATVSVMPTLLLAAGAPPGAKYVAGIDSDVAVILAHGRGKHPAWKVVDPLRKGINRKLGFHTLSLQMPNENKNWKDYADDFPKAHDTIKKGIRFLREEKAVSKIFLVGHSMGSRMASAFVSTNSQQPIDGLVIAGCRNNGGAPLSCDKNLAGVDIPVLDIWGAEDDKDARAAKQRLSMVSSKYTQVSIAGADHRFEGFNKELVSAVVAWLSKQ